MNTLKGKRITVILLTVVLLVTGFFILDPFTASAAGSVKIGQAQANENWGTRGGKAGDQTGSEVCISKWSYNSKNGVYNNWKYVIRAKDPAIARKLADCMKKACVNNHIGYDQAAPDRFTCYDEAKAVGWKLDKIKNDCETTCSSLVSVCLNAVGIKTDRYWDASLVVNDLKATGKFTLLTSSEFTANSDLLEPGDILVSPGAHTAMVVESPNKPGSVIIPSGVSTFKAGKEYQLKDTLYVRTGPGNLYPAKSVSQLTANAQLYAKTWEGKARLQKGTVVTCLKTRGEWVCIPSGWIRGRNGSTIHLVEYKETAAQKSLYEKARVAKSTAAATTTKTSDKTTTAKTSSTAITIKVGKNYILTKTLNVRTGPGLNYKNVKRKNLTKDAKKHATKSPEGRLRKGTEVTCLQVSGVWMRIPSGWICCKAGNLKLPNK